MILGNSLQDVLSAGDEKTFPKQGDELSMHYVGTLASNGTKFDSSRDRNKPFTLKIGVGQVIQGWDEGVMQMSLGEKAVLHISSDFGYGSRGVVGSDEFCRDEMSR
jgi:FK506-binding protein 1